MMPVSVSSWSVQKTLSAFSRDEECQQRCLQPLPAKISVEKKTERKQRRQRRFDPSEWSLYDGHCGTIS
jgi:hypothetical protein